MEKESTCSGNKGRFFIQIFFLFFIRIRVLRKSLEKGKASSVTVLGPKNMGMLQESFSNPKCQLQILLR